MTKINEPLNFSDLDPELEEIINNFSSIFNIRIAYYLPDGSEIKIGSENKIGSDQKISRYCLLLRETLGYKTKCLALDSCKRNRAGETRQIQSCICHGGCNKAIKS